ncbi:hypothetical protein ACGF8B_40725 [Streptomyces sp. NPDC047917]|uniref:hypothetical protein n=1 Tax=Streptomyces sp. NPDC047917 TaxID=3365491 RepID=UPI00371F4D7D
MARTFRFPGGQPSEGEPVLEAAMYAMDAAYLHPVQGLPLHLTGHGGDIVLDASSSCWSVSCRTATAARPTGR